LKISVICFDLSHNCLGRAYLLGKVLRRRYDVEIHGFIHPRGQQTIWSPCNTGEFEYEVVNAKRFPAFLGSMSNLLRDIDGDVIYASKLRLPSFGVGMLAKLFKSRPLLLDVDDLEVSWNHKMPLRRKLRSVLNPCGQLHTELIEKFVGMADNITTVSSALKDRYGRGVLIPHGRDTAHMDPARYEGDQLRSELKLSPYKIIMFLGTPRQHKGLEDVISAMNRLDRPDLRFMVIGAGSDPRYEDLLQSVANNRLILHAEVPFHDVPKYLNLADLVVIPQRDVLPTRFQIPAKLFDAMAMAKPIIASSVSDIPAILKDCGVVYEPGNIDELAGKMDWLLSNPQEALALGARAREKCIAEYSWDVMDERLSTLIECL